jgi:phosphatidylinositol glycan class S
MSQLVGADASPAIKSIPETPQSPSDPLDAVRTKTPPPPETSASLWLRRYVILSFWAVVVILGLPTWWKTTAIYRADLPLSYMTDWADGKVALPIIKRRTTANKESLDM